MSETTLPKRQAVDQQLTWDLTPIFNDDFAYTEAVKQEIGRASCRERVSSPV